MNTIMNIDPWGFLDDLLDTSSRTFRTIRARAAGRFPPVNVFLDDDAVIVDLELPGRTAKDVELTLEPEAVVNADKANAKFTDGILRIELPKAEATGVKRIAIQG